MQLTETQLNAEKTVLGNCIDGADKVAALIEQGFTKAHFVLLAHQKVWSAFETLAKTPEKVNITDLIQHLEAAGELESVGGHAGLVELSTSFAYHFQFEPSVKILVEAKKKRDVESLFISGLENLQNPTLTKDEVLAEAEKVMSSLRESYGVAQVARMAHRRWWKGWSFASRIQDRPRGFLPATPPWTGCWTAYRTRLWWSSEPGRPWGRLPS